MTPSSCRTPVRARMLASLDGVSVSVSRPAYQICTTLEQILGPVALAN